MGRLWRIISFGACAAAALLAIGLVWHRSESPEWKQYQRKAIALTIENLRARLEAESNPEEKAKLQREILNWSQKEPQIISVRPFAGRQPEERCLTCHLGIENLSDSHPNDVFGCVICHGGNGPDLSVAGAHRGLRGGRNPAALDVATASCGVTKTEVGPCHAGRPNHLLNRTENVPKSLMATNAGIIGILRFQWSIEASSHSKYAIKAVSDGRTALGSVPEEIGPNGELRLADSHFRKFCATCHLRAVRQEGALARLDGCPACHASYNKSGFYVGGDATIKRDEPGHPALHRLSNRIQNDRCRACHNRSARIGLSYQGEMESSQYGTPFVNGGLNDQDVDGRFVWKLTPDIHHEKGLACIDCHTGQDTMGNGKIHLFMKDQVEIRCEDCHGTFTKPPASMVINKDDELSQTLIRSGSLKAKEGDIIVMTSKGSPMPHIKLTEKGYELADKLTGKSHPISILTTRKGPHSIRGHERLECDACHSAWSPQCYGCHQALDLEAKGRDHLTGKLTKGRWAEGRTYFRYERNILGINSRGKVGVMVPGCQVWNTVNDETGRNVPAYNSSIMALKNGMSSIAIGSTHPHTTRKEVPRCVDCHLDPKAIGLGEGSLQANGKAQFEPIYDSKSSGLGLEFPIDGIISSKGAPLQGTSHEQARGFNREEVRRILGIGPCLPCHDRYDDPIWQRPGPYVMTPKCRKALEAGLEDAKEPKPPPVAPISANLTPNG
jgi:hypothetical protein